MHHGLSKVSGFCLNSPRPFSAFNLCRILFQAEHLAIPSLRLTTTHPNCDTYLNHTKTVNSSSWPLVAAMEAEKSKHRQYGDAVRNGPHKLLPLVFETYGACGPELHRDVEAIRAEEAWLDKHGLRGETLEMREKRLRLYKKAPFTARSHVNYWRQRFAVTNACGIANFINRAAQHLSLIHI